MVSDSSQGWRASLTRTSVTMPPALRDRLTVIARRLEDSREETVPLWKVIELALDRAGLEEDQ